MIRSSSLPPQRPANAGYRVAIDPPALDEPLLHAVREYWRGKRRDRRMPARADLDVLELRPFMGSMFLIDVLAGGAEFRFRLIGTLLVERFGRDSTGKTFAEAYRDANPATADWLRAIYRRVAAEAVPVWSRAPLDQVGRDFVVSAAIHLPLSADGERVDMIFGASAFTILRQRPR